MLSVGGRRPSFPALSTDVNDGYRCKKSTPNVIGELDARVAVRWLTHARKHLRKGGGFPGTEDNSLTAHNTSLARYAPRPVRISLCYGVLRASRGRSGRGFAATSLTPWLRSRGGAHCEAWRAGAFERAVGEHCGWDAPGCAAATTRSPPRDIAAQMTQLMRMRGWPKRSVERCGDAGCAVSAIRRMRQRQRGARRCVPWGREPAF